MGDAFQDSTASMQYLQHMLHSAWDAAADVPVSDACVTAMQAACSICL
jgi:hypothetical protein